MKKLVLAYSGGLDTSVAISYLTEQGWDVVAVAVDVGQGADLDSAARRAPALGAVETRVVDARERFVEDFIVPALAMNALYQRRYPLVSALSRPLISQVLIEVARETGASAVAHGCTGKGNDQVRFEVALSALEPDIEVLAPVRDWDMTREDAIAYAEARALPVETTRSSPYSVDENLWGRSIECGVLEDPWTTPPEDIFSLTSSASDVPPEPLEVVVGFERGRPVAWDGAPASTAEVIARAGEAAGRFGYGRVDMVEDRLVGIKSREVYEAPAALSLITAHADLESLTTERALARTKRQVEPVWADLVYEGLWFSPLREALDAFAASSQRDVTGEVKLRFANGSCLPVGRRSPVSLYDHSLATYEVGDSFEHGDAEGFIRLWGLPTKQWARRTRTGA